MKCLEIHFEIRITKSFFSFFFFHFSAFFFPFILVWGGQRERERQNLKQAPCEALSSTRGLTSGL